MHIETYLPLTFMHIDVYGYIFRGISNTQIERKILKLEMNRKWNCSNLGHFKIKCIWPDVKNTSFTCFLGHFMIPRVAEKIIKNPIEFGPVEKRRKDLALYNAWNSRYRFDYRFVLFKRFVIQICLNFVLSLRQHQFTLLYRLLITNK